MSAIIICDKCCEKTRGNKIPHDAREAKRFLHIKCEWPNITQKGGKAPTVRVDLCMEHFNKFVDSLPEWYKTAFCKETR